MELTKLTIKEASEKLHSGEIKVADLVDAYLKNLDEKNGELNIYLEKYHDISDQITLAQDMIDSGSATLLTGIPIAIKDNILIKNRTASAASKILENYKATYTATAAQKLIDAGAVLLGRTNMDEFAMGGSTENSAYGVTKNPIDPTCVSGGSSGGSAAAVSAETALAALGSDTGGSIRQPASFCGVVGLKPTYGSVSRHGLMAMASSLDVIGPITKTVEDAEIIFNTISGIDPKDSTSVEGDKSTSPKKIGVPKKYLEKGIAPEVLENFEKSLKRLESLGYEIADIDLPSLDYSLAVYYVLMPAEVSSNMARYDGIKYGKSAVNENGPNKPENLMQVYTKTRGENLGAEVRRRIMLGTYVLSAGYADEYYNKAWQVRNMIKKEFEKAFEKVDIIAMPTSPTPAFKIGEKTNDPLEMYLADIFTVFANLVGVPAISIPDGKVDNLPTGLQLVAPHLAEKNLFEVGKKFEKA